MKQIVCFMIFNLLLSSNAKSQTLTQTIRGTVYDQVTHVPLPGVNVIITGSDPVIGTVTGMDGGFRLNNVPVGKHQLRIMMMGYEDRYLPNLEVSSGKELVVAVYLSERLHQTKEVTVTAEQHKAQPLNEMALASTRSFSVEETQKFAAAVNDPARMAISFAGVVSTDDGNNNISIRGNNPSGLQWRMEGLEIPNPNHFAAPGTAGGGISILSTQLLTNSDFLTGAFPAEYGNALSGVFDLKLRKGNNEKREYTVQAGFLGLDLSTEGPIKKEYGGSYLVNYRYSSLNLIKHIVDIGDGVTNFQDIAYNVQLPAGKKNTFSVFGFAGLSSQEYEAVKDSLQWKKEGGRYGDNFVANTFTSGLTHAVILGNSTWLRSAISYSYQDNRNVTTWLDDNYQLVERFNATYGQGRITLQSVLNHKFNSRISLRAGVVSNNMSFKVEQKEFDMLLRKQVTQLSQQDNASSLQSYAAVSIRASEKLTILPGVHYQYLWLNNTQSFEPRFSMKYAADNRNIFTLGYGRHGQLQPVGIYFTLSANGEELNKNLGLSQSDHFVLAYDRMLTEKLHIKTEVYYQALSNIPVGIDSNSVSSSLNLLWGFTSEAMANKGKGKNYGLEFTVEQFMQDNLYFLLSAALLNSEYSDQYGDWHNTRFNTGYNLTFTAGKEWAVGNPSKHRMLGVNFKTIWSGGMRQTPLDPEASAISGESVYIDEQAFTLQNPDYFRVDFKLSLKRNRPSSTHVLALDVQNATNHKNVYGQFYDDTTGGIKTYYQSPLIPILSYRVQF